jgi:ADP-ribose pyrophosphatase
VIELGETLQRAGQRELHEECGIQIEIRRVLNVVDNIVFDESKHIRFHYIVIYLLAQYLDGEARPGSDASEVRWIASEDLGTLNMHPLARQAVQQAFTMA